MSEQVIEKHDRIQRHHNSQDISFYVVYGARQPYSDNEKIISNSQKLIEKFGYPWEMMPLMYVILKDTSGDIDEASKRIEEGQQVIEEYKSQYNLNMYDEDTLRRATKPRQREPDSERGNQIECEASSTKRNRNHEKDDEIKFNCNRLENKSNGKSLKKERCIYSDEKEHEDLTIKRIRHNNNEKDILMNEWDKIRKRRREEFIYSSDEKGEHEDPPIKRVRVHNETDLLTNECERIKERRRRDEIIYNDEKDIQTEHEDPSFKRLRVHNETDLLNQYERNRLNRSLSDGQHVVNEYSRQYNLNMYDGCELRCATRQCG
uniref:Doublesex dimerisation domain-containing protein n=1 Tax=Glossina austeni TaxID=7395 RepID=A0A1A9V4N9_GLOAU